MNENIKDTQVQRYCSHDVVALAAIDDAASVKQDEARHQQDHRG